MVVGHDAAMHVAVQLVTVGQEGIWWCGSHGFETAQPLLERGKVLVCPVCRLKEGGNERVRRAQQVKQQEQVDGREPSAVDGEWRVVLHFPSLGQGPILISAVFIALRITYLAPYRLSVAVQEAKASSPSSSSTCTPDSSSSPLSRPCAFIDSHFRVRASSTLLTACRIIAHGAALSIAPTKPLGWRRLS
jgi:hypothetical protein